MRFAIALNNNDNGMPKITDECFLYGSISGCDKYCPVFQKGQCELQEENQKIFDKEE